MTGILTQSVKFVKVHNIELLWNLVIMDIIVIHVTKQPDSQIMIGAQSVTFYTLELEFWTSKEVPSDCEKYSVENDEWTVISPMLENL